MARRRGGPPVGGPGTGMGNPHPKRRARPRPQQTGSRGSGAHPHGRGNGGRTAPPSRPPSTSRGVQDVQRPHTRPAPTRQPGPSSDAERRKVARHRRRQSYETSVKEAYKAQPLGKRRLRVKLAEKRTKQGKATREDRAVLEVHRNRQASDKRTLNTQIYEDRERKIVEAYQRREAAKPKHADTKPSKRKDGGSALTKFLHTITAPAELFEPSAKAGAKAVTHPKRELEGRGEIAKASDKVAKFVAKNAVVVGTGSGPVTEKGNTVPVKVDESQFAKNLVKDAFNLPAQAVPSVYVPAAALYEASPVSPTGTKKSDTTRLKQLARDIDEHDPVYNLGAAAVEAAGGDTKAANERLTRAYNAAMEHPGFTAAEAFGVKGTVGRGLGRTIRGTGRVTEAAGRVTKNPTTQQLGRRLHRVASTAREPAVLPGTTLRQKRTYSKDVFTKARQRHMERRRIRHVENLRAHADLWEDESPRRAAELRREADRKDPRIMDEKEISRRLTERVDVSETIRRQNRAEVRKEAQDIIKGAGDDGAALSLFVQRITDATPEDLRAYRDELAAEFDTLGPAAKASNKELRRQIDRSLKGELDTRKLTAAPDEYVKKSEELQIKLVERGLLDGEQAERAALFPYAVRRMGAIYERRRGLLDDDGVPLTTAAIREHMRANGVDPAAFVSHSPTANSRSAYNITSNRAPSIGPQRRTGASTRQGTFDASGEMLERQIARARGLADAAEAFRNTVKEFALRRRPEDLGRMEGVGSLPEDGDPYPVVTAGSRRAAQKIADDLLYDEYGNLRPNAIKYVPVRLTPFKGRGEQMEDILERFEPDSQVGHDAMTQAAESALRGEEGPLPSAAESLPAAPERNQRITWRDIEDGDGVSADLDGVAAVLDTEDGGEWTYAIFDTDTDDIVAQGVAEAFDDARVEAERALRVAALDKNGAEVPDTPPATVTTAQSGPWVLIPEAAASTWLKHLRVSNPDPWAKAAQVGSQHFRKAVLTTSLRWLAGNVTEATFRAAIAGAGLRSFLTGHRLLKAVDAQDAAKGEELRARAVGGGHLANASRQHLHRDVEDFRGSNLEPLATAMNRFAREPGARHLAGIWNTYTHHVFEASAWVERQFQTAMLGKAVRESDLMSGELRKTGAKAIEQAADGLLDTNEQVAFGRMVDDMYGRYGKRNPMERRLIAAYTPFIAWALAATKFVAVVLPRDHPTTVAVIAAAEIATADWREEMGADVFGSDLPGWLQGSIPTEGGSGPRYRSPQGLLPFGAFGDPLGTVEGLVLPQVSGMLDAFQGQDWRGFPIKSRTGAGEPDVIDKLTEAGKAVAGGYLPFYSRGVSAEKKGLGQSLADSVTGRTAPLEQSTTNKRLREINREMRQMRENKTDRTKDRRTYTKKYYKLLQEAASIKATDKDERKKAREQQENYPDVGPGNTPAGEGETGGTGLGSDSGGAGLGNSSGLGGTIYISPRKRRVIERKYGDLFDALAELIS